MKSRIMRDFFCMYIRTPVVRLKNFLLALSRRKKILFCVLAILLVWFYLSLPSKLFLSPTSYVLEDSRESLKRIYCGRWAMAFPYDLMYRINFQNVSPPLKTAVLYHPGVDPLLLQGQFFKT
jgi:penicillin-binding protein 1C